MLFALIYLPHLLTIRTSDFHRGLYDLVWERRVAIAAPRSFAKSTIFSVIYPLWAILFEKKKNIILVSATGSLAEVMLRRIKKELEENEKIIEDFGNVQSTKWTESNIILKNGAELQAKGAGYQIRGFRPDAIICDDLENDEAVRSAEQREKLEDWFWSSLVNTLEPEQQLLIVGTLLHSQSFLKKLIETPPRRWQVRLFKAIKEDGTPLWEEKWPLEALEERRQEIGEKRFQKEFMNNPLANADTVFKPEWIDPYIVRTYPDVKEMDIYTAIDPAISKKDLADYTAIITVGLDRKTKEIYVLEVKAGKWSVYETVDEIQKTFEKWNPRSMVVEEVQYQAALRQVVIKETREKGLYLPIRQIKADGDKIRRASNVSHLLEQGLVHLLVHQDALREQLINFPEADHDDLVDALVYALTILYGGNANITRPIRVTSQSKPTLFTDPNNLERAMKVKRRKAWFR